MVSIWCAYRIVNGDNLQKLPKKLEGRVGCCSDPALCDSPPEESGNLSSPLDQDDEDCHPGQQSCELQPVDRTARAIFRPGCLDPFPYSLLLFLLFNPKEVEQKGHTHPLFSILFIEIFLSNRNYY